VELGGGGKLAAQGGLQVREHPQPPELISEKLINSVKNRIQKINFLYF
jgi:hypothetical protein